MRTLLLTVISLIAVTIAYGQKTHLDTEKYAPCELFVQKSGYDWQQRLLQIDSLEDKEVTVFEVKGKDNQIKTSYTGTIKNPRKKSDKAPEKGWATVITVVTDMGNGQKSAHFPLTNNKNYRIYLKSCLSN